MRCSVRLFLLLFSLGIAATDSHPRAGPTQLSRGCLHLQWQEVLRLAEKHTEGARKCLERFLAKKPVGDEAALAAVLLEEWEMDPQKDINLRDPRPLGPDSGCYSNPEVKAAIEMARPYMIVFEVWVNEAGQATQARVLRRIPPKPVELFEQCEIAFALSGKYRPARKNMHFVSGKYLFASRWDYW